MSEAISHLIIAGHSYNTPIYITYEFYSNNEITNNICPKIKNQSKGGNTQLSI